MCINSRERRRMHNLNEALDGLRRVIPRSDNPNQRKISKIATINLATKWFVFTYFSIVCFEVYIIFDCNFDIKYLHIHIAAIPI